MNTFDFIKEHKKIMSVVYKNNITPTVIDSYVEIYTYFIDTVKDADNIMVGYTNTSIEFGMSVSAVRKVVKKMSALLL